MPHVSIDKANPISTKIYTTWVNKQARTPFSNYHSLYNSQRSDKALENMSIFSLSKFIFHNINKDKENTINQ